jgi:hypothetical protein
MTLACYLGWWIAEVLDRDSSGLVLAGPLALAIGAIAIGAAAMIYGALRRNATQVFLKAATTTEATVLDCDTQEYEDAYGGKSHTYHVTVRFDANGKQMTLKAKVGGELYGRLEQGQTISMRYAKDDPRIALLEGES